MKQHSKAAYIQKGWHFTDLQPWNQLQTEIEKKKGLLMRTTEGGNGSLRARSSTRHLLDAGAASRKLEAIMSMSMRRDSTWARRISLTSGQKSKHACHARCWCFSEINLLSPSTQNDPMALFLLEKSEDLSVQLLQGNTKFSCKTFIAYFLFFF